jgi:iron-sulfur cluster assembly protein
MFGVPGGKPLLTLTPKAVARLRKLMEATDDPVYALRIGVKKGGCAGMEYTMDYAKEAQPGDEMVEQDGARVLIAPLATMFMIGTEIDFETGLLESGFRFRNPNVSEACGCGESVKFDVPAGA